MQFPQLIIELKITNTPFIVDISGDDDAYSTLDVDGNYAWKSNICNNYSDQDATLSACFDLDNSCSGLGIWGKHFQSLSITANLRQPTSTVLVNEAKVNSWLIRGNSARTWEQAYLSAFPRNGNQLERGWAETHSELC